MSTDKDFIGYLLWLERNRLDNSRSNHTRNASMKKFMTLRQAIGNRLDEINVEAADCIANYLEPLEEAKHPIYLLVASLFTNHTGTHSNTRASLGSAMSALGDSDSLTLRFKALLRADKNEWTTHLRMAISLLSSKGQTLDYRRLLCDLCAWDIKVERRWAADFWRTRLPAEYQIVNNTADAFITFLDTQEKNGAMCAAFRRYFADDSYAVDIYPWLAPFLSEEPREHEAWFLTASLFGLHPEHDDTPYQNIGDVWQQVCQRRSSGKDSLEMRFIALLDSHVNDVPNHLKAIFRLAEQERIPVNYKVLLKDLTGWSHPDRYVQRQWAEHFWASDKDAA